MNKRERTPLVRTEVGLIPCEWSARPLEDIVDRSAPICYGVVQVGRDTDGGVPIVAIKHLKSIGTAELHRVEPQRERPYVRSRVQLGDVLLSIKGTIGRVGMVPSGFSGNISREIARLRPDQAIVSEYLAHQLESGGTQARIASEIVGTTRQEFSIGNLRRFRVAIPDSELEQRTIAAALSDADALIESLEQLIAKKRQIKQGAMQELLTGKRRLPGFIGKWAELSFSKVLDRINVKAHQVSAREYQSAGRYPVVDQGQGLIVGFSDASERRFSCPTNGVIVFGDHTCIVKFVDFDFLVGADGTQVLCGKNDQCTRFQAYSLQHAGVIATGYNRHFRLLAERAFLAPPRLEQEAIAEVLTAMDDEICALETSLSKARALKQGMMQELLTGRIRLV